MTDSPPSPRPDRLRLERPFLVFLVLSLVFLGTFAFWTSLVLAESSLVEVDRFLASALAEFSTEHPQGRRILILVTSCGGIRANFLISLVGVAWMWHHHRRRFAVAWAAIALGGGLIVLELKEHVDRDRPPPALRDPAVHQQNESYPSGHAMGSVVGYGMLGFALLPAMHRRSRKTLLIGGLTLWVLLIGFSRIYLRAHWFSDVIGGFLLGLAYMHGCLAIHLWRRHRTTTHDVSGSPTAAR